MFKDTSKTLVELIQRIKLQLRGWINYYGKLRPSDMQKVFSPINKQIGRWYAKKHKCGYIEASEKVQQIAVNHKYLFVHWYWGQTSF